LLASLVPRCGTIRVACGNVAVFFCLEVVNEGYEPRTSVHTYHDKSVVTL